MKMLWFPILVVNIALAAQGCYWNMKTVRLRSDALRVLERAEQLRREAVILAAPCGPSGPIAEAR